MKHFILFLLLAISGICSRVAAQLPEYRWSSVSNSGNGSYVFFQKNATDRWNNSYVTGMIYNTAKFGPFTLNALGYYDAFVAKLDSGGNYLWVRRIGGGGYDMGYSVAVDTSGNVYAVGYFSQEVIFDSSSVNHKRTASGNNDIYIVKYDEDGNFKWVSAIGGISCEQAQGVTTDREGNLFVTGNFSDLVFFGNTATPITSSGGKDGFIVKLKANNGVAQWARKIGGTSDDYGSDVAVDDYGNSYVTGSFNSSNCGLFNSPSTAGISISHGGGGANGFLCKYDPNGFAQWGQRTAPLANSYYYIYTGCYYYYWGWHNYNPSVATDGYGGIYLSGTFSGTLNIGTATKTSYGKADVFVARYDLGGNLEWLEQLGSQNHDVNYDLASDASSNVYLVGSMPGRDTFYIAQTGKMHPSRQSGFSNDIFITKLDYQGNSVWGVRGTAGAHYYYNDYWSSNFLSGASVNDVGGIYVSGFFWNYSWLNQEELKFYVNNDTIPQGDIDNQWYYISHLTKFQQNEYIRTGKLFQHGFCKGDTIKVPFFARGPFSSTNKFQVHLSDTKGGFLNHAIIASKVSDQEGYDTLYAVIPDTMPYATGYMLRVVSTDKMLRGNTNGSNFSIGVIKPKMGEDVTVCLGDSIKLTVTQGQNFRWLPNPAVRPADSNRISIWVKPTATVDLRGRNTNFAGCTDFDTIRVTVIPRVIPSAGPDAYVCHKDTIRLKATGGIAYKWTPAYGLSADNVAEPYCFTDSTINYVVEVHNGACSDYDTVLITAKPALGVSITPTPTICAGTYVTMKANPTGGLGAGNYYFKWSNGMTGDSITVRLDTTTAFTVTLTDSCSRVKAVGNHTVTVLPQLSLTPANTTTICFGQTATLGSLAMGGKNNRHVVHWFDMRTNTYEGIGFLKKLSPLDTTTYRLILTDSCSAYPDTAYVTVNVKPRLQIFGRGDTTICYGGSADLKVSSAGGDNVPHQYTWMHDGSLVDELTVTPLVSTDYIVKVSDGCTVPDEYDTIRVVVRDPLKVTIPATVTICLGQTIQLQAIGAGGDSTKWQFIWDDGAHFGPNWTVTPGITTTYKIKLTDGCTNPEDSATITVIVRDVLSLDITNDTTICEGITKTLQVTPAGGFPGNYTISWDQGLGTGDTKVVTPDTTTTYTVILDDGCSPPVTKSITITVIPTPMIDFGASDTAICPGKPIQFFNYTSGPGPYTYLWDFGDGTTSADASPVHLYAMSGNYTVRLYAQTPEGCNATAEKQNYVNIFPVPQARFVVEPKETDLNDTKISFTSTSVGATEHYWVLGDGAEREGINSFRHEYNDTGYYFTRLVVFNNEGCTDTSELQRVHIKDVFTVHVPSAFTVNNDGKNEVFRAGFTGAVKVRLMVYNRWGQVVYDGEGATKGWDGTGVNGEPAMQDTYMYQFIVEDLKGRIHNVYGSVILLR